MKESEDVTCPLCGRLAYKPRSHTAIYRRGRRLCRKCANQVEFLSDRNVLLVFVLFMVVTMIIGYFLNC